MKDLLVTLDTDWAPDFVIDHAAAILREHSVCATWFVTHRSEAIERLRDDPELFELGIHPNFLHTSTQGEETDQILSYCMELVPDAQCCRTHSNVQSTHLLGQILALTPVRTDVTHFLPKTPGLRPFEYHWRGRRMLRIPYYWEDDFEMEWPSPNWHLAPHLGADDGLRIFNFHPMHVYLNSDSICPYHVLRERVSRMNEARKEDLAPLVRHDEEGTATLFREVAEHLAAVGASMRIRDLRDRWEQESPERRKSP